jgi:hypothetical protein
MAQQRAVQPLMIEPYEEKSLCFELYSLRWGCFESTARWKRNPLMFQRWRSDLRHYLVMMNQQQRYFRLITGHISSGFQTKIWYVFLISFMHSTCPVRFTSSDMILPFYIWWGVERMSVFSFCREAQNSVKFKVIWTGEYNKLWLSSLCHYFQIPVTFFIRSPHEYHGSFGCIIKMLVIHRIYLV